MEIGLKPTKNQGRFGLPGIPVLIKDQGDEEDPSDFDIIFAIRLTVSEAEKINVVPPATWEMMRDGGQMVICPGRHDFAWPKLPEIELDPNPQEKEGRFKFIEDAVV